MVDRKLDLKPENLKVSVFQLIKTRFGVGYLYYLHYLWVGNNSNHFLALWKWINENTYVWHDGVVMGNSWFPLFLPTLPAMRNACLKWSRPGSQFRLNLSRWHFPRIYKINAHKFIRLIQLLIRIWGLKVWSLPIKIRRCLYQVSFSHYIRTSGRVQASQSNLSTF